MRTVLILILFVDFISLSKAQNVSIGRQVWSSRNLDVSNFKNGDVIPQAKSKADLDIAAEKGEAAWCYYNHESAIGNKYGKLYNWYAVIDPRGLCPVGWHLPSVEEWRILESHLGEDDSGRKMKTKSNWKVADTSMGGVNGNNESGFSALPAGRYSSPDFYELDLSAFFWSSTISSPTVWLYYFFGNLQIYEVDDESELKGLAQSVRCVKD